MLFPFVRVQIFRYIQCEREEDSLLRPASPVGDQVVISKDRCPFLDQGFETSSRIHKRRNAEVRIEQGHGRLSRMDDAGRSGDGKVILELSRYQELVDEGDS
jgi:hypothetical protein